MMSGPTIDRGNSSGDIWTPQVFRDAVTKRFGAPVWDLAASATNHFGPHWFDEREDSLTIPWGGLDGLCWLNPPFANITPWARKCRVDSHNGGAEILLLVPMGSQNWYWDFVEPYADVYCVGRMVFDNCFDRKTGELVTTAYAKDLILAHYARDITRGRRWTQRPQRWRWELAIS